MSVPIPTKFLILSDTHSEALLHPPKTQVDVVIHCGDLTEESELHEFRSSIGLLQKLNAPLNLVIPGNHDWTLDTPMFEKKIAEMKPSREDLNLVEKTYGKLGEARRLFEEAKADGFHLLNEGTHTFTLANGAVFTVYASPFTQSTNDWWFQYSPQFDHVWSISQNIDVAITHSPSQGILDMTSSRERAGSPSLFAAIARTKLQMHCFGHLHESWGAKLVSWREDVGEEPSHFTSIDNDKSKGIETLATPRRGNFDAPEDIEWKESRRK